MGSPRIPVRTLVVCLIALLLASVAGAESARRPDKAPKKDAVAGELLVRFEDGASEAEQDRVLAAAGAKAAKSLGRHHTKLATTDPAATERALKILAAQPSVDYAERNYRVHATAVPTDPSFTQLWGLRNTGQNVNGVSGTPDADIDADEAWNVTTGSSAVTVAVIDTGVDFSHPDLGGSMTSSTLMWTNPGESCTGCRTDGVDNDGNGYVDDWRGWDFVNNDNNPTDDYGHGSHVAGTIGALANNGTGVAGINWNVKIMALKFLDSTGSGTLDDAVEAVRYATRMGVTASNNSWGGGPETDSLRDAIVEADAAGSLFVAAAGNDSNDNDALASYPASYDIPNVIAVAATDQNDQLADFSNYGRSSVDLGAPGVNIYSTLPGGGYDWWDGTSMATPHVTGVVALAKAAHPGATAQGIKGLLLGSVDGRPGLVGLAKSEGRLNAARAVTCTGAPRVWIDQPGPGFRASVGNALNITAIGSTCGNPAGTTVSATVNGAAVTLSARGDGLYTGSYTPATAGNVTVSVTAGAGAATETRSVTGVVQDNYRTVDDTYAWIDATVGGTRLTLFDDDSAVVSLPFSFRFYDVSRSSVEISSNGYLMFDGLFGTSYVNKAIPNSAEPNSLVAAYWDDLNPSAGGGAVWYRSTGTAPNRKFVVAWVGVPAFGTTNGVTFEAILEEGTNDIVLQYKDVDHGDSFLNYGASATVGVEDDLGSSGKQFLYEQALLQPYQTAKSLRFTLGAGAAPPPPDGTPPAAPTSLVATPGGNQVALDWADNVEPDLAGYRVERLAADGTWSAIASPTASAYTQTGLTNGTAYTYRVVALDLAGNASAPSASATATPFGIATYAPGSYTITTGRFKTGSLASLTSNDGNRLVVDANKLSSTLFRAELQATLTVPSAQLSTLRALTVRYDGHVNQSTASLQIRVLNQRTGAWVTIDGPSTGVTADRLVTWNAAVPSDFVSSTGEVRVGAFGERSRDFLLRSDLISITVGY
jgi:subtilisin family serine protease